MLQFLQARRWETPQLPRQRGSELPRSRRSRYHEVCLHWGGLVPTRKGEPITPSDIYVHDGGHVCRSGKDARKRQGGNANRWPRSPNCTPPPERSPDRLPDIREDSHRIRSDVSSWFRKRTWPTETPPCGRQREKRPQGRSAPPGLCKYDELNLDRYLVPCTRSNHDSPIIPRYLAQIGSTRSMKAWRLSTTFTSTPSSLIFDRPFK